MKYTPDFSSRFRILKGGKISLVVSALVAGSTIAFASPTGGQVTTGLANISQSGSTTTINQSTNKASINWQSFNIAPSETVNFVQPSASSVTLNRVIGTSSSLIEGMMNANGQVFLLNPNGVLFSKTATVNVGGLVASTLNITDANFQAGNYAFEGNSQNGVLNMGTITTTQGGYVAMMGKNVANEGTIVATMGNVQMAGGDKISLNLNGNSLVKLTIDEGTLNALVENKGLIKADGGQVFLTTAALNTILDGMVNNSGVIEAKTLNDVTGKIELFAHGGTGNFGGTLSTGKGEGFIETSGKVFTNQADLKVETGNWLIDPVNITINSTLAGTISTALASGDVTITTAGSNTPSTTSGESGTDGDIFVNSAINWGSAQKLTLSADKSIYLFADITATNAAGQLALHYNQSPSSGAGYFFKGGKINLNAGDNFFTQDASSGELTWKVITDLGASRDSVTGTDLQGINGNTSGRYVLGANIDASATTGWTVSASEVGFNPISSFSGSFDGLGHTIDNLYIKRYEIFNQNGTGLFGSTTSASTMQNLGLTHVNIDTTGEQGVGSLIGISKGLISNVFTTGNIVGWASVGGIIGEMQLGTLKNSYSTANVSSEARGGGGIGGLVGRMLSTLSWDSILITNSYYAPTDTTIAYNVSGSNGFNDGTGGIVGRTEGSSTSMSIEYSYVNGAKINGGAGSAGGLAGYMSKGSITESYAVTPEIIGATAKVGGLVGSYAATPTITNAYWDSDVSGSTPSGVGTSKTTTEMKTASTFNGFLSAGNWSLQDGYYPVLSALQKTGLIVTMDSDSKTYDGIAYSSTPTYSTNIIKNGATVNGTLSAGGDASGATNAGTYTISGSGLGLAGLSTQQDFQDWKVVYVNGALTINQRPVDITVAKDYNTNVNFTTGFTLGNIVSGETVTLTGTPTAAVSSVNPNSYSSFASQSLTLSNPNYTLTGGTISATINKLPATYTLSGASVANGASVNTGTAITLPTSTLTGGTTPTGTPTITVYDSLNADVTAAAVAGTLAAGSYTIKTFLSDTIYDVSNTSTTIAFSVVTPPPPPAPAPSGPSAAEIAAQQAADAAAALAAQQAAAAAAALAAQQAADAAAALAAQQAADAAAALAAQQAEAARFSALEAARAEAARLAALNQQTTSIVTNIVNSAVTNTVLPTTIAPVANIFPVATPQQAQVQVQNSVLVQTIMAPQGGSSSGTTYNLVGTTNGGAVAQTVTMDQLQATTLAQGGGDIHVPLGNGSVVDLINGGVTLPAGVSQEFYVVASSNNAATTSTSGNTSTNTTNDSLDNEKKR